MKNREKKEIHDTVDGLIDILKSIVQSLKVRLHQPC